ncbi:hypothetical protein Bbelb_082180 [Branchiostoma belcheri]|nr:hypothetical protein Bbelb_082180 [Branchiostoma belcheri]
MNPRVSLPVGLFVLVIMGTGVTGQVAPDIEVITAWPSPNLYYLESLTLTCYGGGDPAPTYTWTLDSGPVPARAVLDTSAGTLTLADATDADGGVYTCTADNGAGTAATLNVTVVGCPDISTCTDSNSYCPSWASIGECDNNPGYMLPNCPLSCGVCFPNLGAHCTNTRRGRSWDTWECYDVTTVPADVQSELNLDTSFYQKYLHAYGIPILGSSILPDDALRRACYDVLFLLADRKDVRDSYYNYYGRAAIMDDTEVTLDIPEHSNLDPVFTRARGLAGTVSRPVSTGAEENVLCFSNDSYRVEDTFIHGFAQGLDILGARKVISDFQTRLQAAYDSALDNGLWANTFADDTRDSYWAEGVQSFFNVNHERDPPDGIHNHVNTRTELQAYDPDLYAIIEDIFPCRNFLVKRCVRDYESYTLKMDCFSENYQRATVVGNAVWGETSTSTAASQGATPTPPASTRTVSQTTTVSTPSVSRPTSHTASIAPQSTGSTPTVSLTQSSTVTTLTPTVTSRATPSQSTVAPDIKVISAWPSPNLYYLESLTLTCYGGGDPAPTYTWTLDSGPVPARAMVDTSAGTLTLADATDADGGVYTCTAENGAGTAATLNVTVVGCPDTSTCTDSNSHCPSWASIGECDNNPGYMLPNCPLSCGVCFPNLGAHCTNTRRGRSWDTWECYDVTTVPADVQSELNLDTSFYQKYLHAYGIPILGSSILPDDALRRACYDVLFLLADRKDVRDSYYNYYGRAAIMDDTEVTLDIPEHSNLDPVFTRARGLAGTVSRPVSTGSEENVLCFSNDSYRVEDIFIHGFAQGLDILGARKVISDFQTRLQAAYDSALDNGLWANTFADDTRDAYWAEGVQSFFNVNHERDPPDGIHNHVNTRTELQAYDPDLYAIIEDIFPCGNFLVKRCVRDYESYTLKMDCFSENYQRATVVGNAVWGETSTSTAASQVDGGWSDWSPWSACSVTCGVGTETRGRTCTNPAPANGGADCDGLDQETQDCGTGVLCPVDGNWTDWSPWSACSVTCGVGTETRDRTCTNPAPANGGADCDGLDQETQDCDTGVICSAVSDLTFHDIEADQMTLSWTASDDVTQYRLRYRHAGASYQDLSPPPAPGDTQATVRGLWADTEYNFTLTAFGENDEEIGEISGTETTGSSAIRADVDNMHLLNDSCRATYTETEVTLRTGLQECGTIQESSGGKIIFSNEAFGNPVEQDNGAVRGATLRKRFQCEFVSQFVVSQERNILFNIPPPRVEVENAENQFTFEMHMFTSPDFVRTYNSPDYPVQVTPSDQLNFGLSVNSPLDNLELLALHCLATPSTDPDDSPSVSIIQDGCDIDTTLQLNTELSNDMALYYSIQSFTFPNVVDPSLVYIHCTMVVCFKDDPDSRCSEGCTPARRRRRAVSDMSEAGVLRASGRRGILSTGISLTHIYALIPENPWEDLSATDGPTFCDPGGPSTLPTVGIAVGTAAGIAGVLLMVTAVFLVRKKRGRDVKKQAEDRVGFDNYSFELWGKGKADNATPKPE